MASNSSNDGPTIVGEITKDKEYLLQEYPLKKSEAISAVGFQRINNIIRQLFLCQYFGDIVGYFLGTLKRLIQLKIHSKIELHFRSLLFVF